MKKKEDNSEVLYEKTWTTPAKKVDPQKDWQLLLHRPWNDGFLEAPDTQL